MFWHTLTLRISKVRYKNAGRLVLIGKVGPTKDNHHWFRTAYSPNRCLFVFISERIARFVNALTSSVREGAFDTNQAFPVPPVAH
ncbi:hypothetical protein B9Z55_027852 [Caenorhabditis nigoni]|uniref:Uncharacterized protein n=1 Tax=Caenorhabditis nigoni TaxID=1611254 RepID=A0A2G5SE31_9PELO|nr:hypothetical protein B9Z55_027852 [Caenorhabditis nigoni]